MKLGDRAVVFARPAAVSARAIVETVKAWPGVVDVVVALEDVAAYFANEPVIADGAIAALAKLGGSDEPVREVWLRAVYDGADVDELERTLGVDVRALHRAATYTVEAIGFAPGFAYMSGLDARLHVPRRVTPRTRVPAGALAIAGPYTAVYPFDSPGGWHLIGHVDEPMFGADGARLRLGDRVRFA